MQCTEIHSFVKTQFKTEIKLFCFIRQNGKCLYLWYHCNHKWHFNKSLNTCNNFFSATTKTCTLCNQQITRCNRSGLLQRIAISEFKLLFKPQQKYNNKPFNGHLSRTTRVSWYQKHIDSLTPCLCSYLYNIFN